MTDTENNGKNHESEELQEDTAELDEELDNVTELPLDRSEPSDDEQDVEEQLQALNDKYLRAIADADNLRRRMDKERLDVLKYGNEKILTDMLPVLDSFEKAFVDAEKLQNESVSSFFEGFKLVYDQLKTGLEKHGLERVASKDQPFDPNVHQAIRKVDDEEVEQDTVDEEYAAGYTLNGRLIRPAMVSVKTPTGKH